MTTGEADRVAGEASDVSDRTTLGVELADLVLRITAKRERWRLLARELGADASFGPGILAMTQALDAAWAAIEAAHNANAAARAALDDLKTFDEED